ncbi:D-alanine--poly(phosphoribitol) ligase [Paraburkholderia panacisoli]|uniref:D-alanine--poly(Phosphoribitol) ligase n=1 Tax=Paraburkholderia panacisoli TaxID=2603818 RepID=A0A5B0GFW4_9BURK|nr:AMP-binding protein [Paraburkholderia panacisoli]KAA1001000.1 D-alanine--poly(phosphoribitol) ligase [Paraburkholderia panacisoli]
MRFDLATSHFVDADVDPDAFAVIGSERNLSWRELANASEAWCEAARAKGFAADVPVIVRGDKEAEFVVAMVGALMLGAPYVPIDTVYPDERMQRIARTLDAHAYYDTRTRAFVPLRDGMAPNALRETHLAYIMFTSGTTGEPKGVQIGRESVNALIDWMHHFKLGTAPVFLNLVPFSFDVSMYEVFGMLSSGGTVVLTERSPLESGASPVVRAAEHNVTTWVSTPSFAQRQLLDSRFSAQGLPTLRTFLFCGEVLPVGLVRALRTRFPDVRLINTYGPTEATVATTWIVIDDEVLARHSPLPIGYANREGQVFVDDDELCIVGPHVMRGYLNRDDLNATRMFTRNGMRGFRTGDLGSAGDDGLLFCHGRIDDQVKLTGYRIELMEIDAALCELPGDAPAAAVPLRRPDGSVARIVGFVETGEGDWRLPDALRDWQARLAERLPSYMIPSELIGCRALPVSANFKIDRARLAEDYRGGHFKAVTHAAQPE